jgi:hypothetical protein
MERNKQGDWAAQDQARCLIRAIEELKRCRVEAARLTL